MKIKESLKYFIFGLTLFAIADILAYIFMNLLASIVIFALFWWLGSANLLIGYYCTKKEEEQKNAKTNE